MVSDQEICQPADQEEIKEDSENIKMSRSKRYTNLKPYRYILNGSDPQGTCCLCDGRKVYTRKSICDGLVDSYFAEGQRPSWGMHPCYGYTQDPTEIGLCLYSNKSNPRLYSCMEVTVGDRNTNGKINYCDYETIFGFGTNRVDEKRKEYEFRFIPLPSWSMCGKQKSGNAVPGNLIGKDYGNDSISIKGILPFDTAIAQGPIKKPVHRNSGKIINIIKDGTDNSKVLQITESKDFKNRKLLKIKTRLDNP